MESDETKAIDALPYGCEVVIGDHVEGRVTAVLIRGDHVQYEVRWWSGRDHKFAWLDASEVTPKVDARPMSVGFKVPQ